MLTDVRRSLGFFVAAVRLLMMGKRTTTGGVVRKSSLFFLLVGRSGAERDAVTTGIIVGVQPTTPNVYVAKARRTKAVILSRRALDRMNVKRRKF